MLSIDNFIEKTVSPNSFNAVAFDWCEYSLAMGHV